MAEETTIRMANQIAAFFHSKPEDIGVAMIAEHISKFWEQRMRKELFALIDAQNPALDPWIIAARGQIRPA